MTKKAQIRALICHATTTVAADAVQTLLATSALFETVDLIDCGKQIMNISVLLKYHVVLAWSGNVFFNSFALGNVLVILLNFVCRHEEFCLELYDTRVVGRLC